MNMDEIRKEQQREERVEKATIASNIAHGRELNSNERRNLINMGQVKAAEADVNSSLGQRLRRFFGL